MSNPAPRPEAIPQDAPVADAYDANWVDTRAPQWARPYLRLSRVDRPIGTWLLLIPCWWAVALACAAQGEVTLRALWVALGCTLGALVMRGAGCTWNDITDRHIDGKVARTALRPLPSGAVTVRQALIWMAAQCLIGLVILLTFGPLAVMLGVASLGLVALYPFAKRFTWWPQVFLGLAFNFGALLAWAATTGSLHWAALWLYIAGILWTVFYDTIYAHQDAEDDALIGVKSTARLFGAQSPRILPLFGGAATAFLVIAAGSALAGHGALWLALAAPLAFGAHLRRQMALFDPQDAAGCTQIFRSNRDAGLWPVLFFAAAALL